MKIRNGFVSNSSSSSFILPFVKGGTFKLSIDMNLFKSFFDDARDSYIESIISDENELKDYFQRQYGDGYPFNLDDMEDYIRDDYNRCLDILREGKMVVVGHVDQIDGTLDTVLRKMGANIDGY